MQRPLLGRLAQRYRVGPRAKAYLYPYECLTSPVQVPRLRQLCLCVAGDPPSTGARYYLYKYGTSTTAFEELRDKREQRERLCLSWIGTAMPSSWIRVCGEYEESLFFSFPQRDWAARPVTPSVAPRLRRGRQGTGVPAMRQSGHGMIIRGIILRTVENTETHCPATTATFLRTESASASARRLPARESGCPLAALWLPSGY